MKPRGVRLIPIILLYTILAAGFVAGAWADPAAKSKPFRENERISEIEIKIDAPPGARDRLSELAGKLIRVKKEAPFSPENMQQSIDALKRSNRFEKIHADLMEKNDGLHLLFRLTPFRLIRDIKIQKAFPLLEKDILSAMTLRPGDVFSDKKRDEQIEGITAYLKQEGYPAPKIKILVEEDPVDRHVDIHVHLDKGRSLVLDRIVFKGNKSVSTFRLNSMMKIRSTFYTFFISKRFVEKTLKKDIENLIRYYRNKSFPDCMITYSAETLPGDRVMVKVEIKEGDRYLISFSGNNHISSRKLRKKGLRFTQGNRNDTGLKKSAAAMMDMYREAGFSGTRVQFEETPSSGNRQNIREIRFLIKEEERFSVDSVFIEGNTALSTKSIKQQMLTRENGILKKDYFLPGILNDDVDSIKTLYRKSGFMATEVHKTVQADQKNQRVSVALKIEEKTQTLVSSIHLNGLSAVSNKTALKAIGHAVGKPYRKYLLQSDENTLSVLISEAGYPFVVVAGSAQISKDQRSARVTYDIRQGPPVKMGEIFFSGNFRTGRDVLVSAMDLKPDSPFSLKKMLEGQKSLRDMDIFNSVRFTPVGLKEKWDQVHLLVDLEEKKPYFVEFGTGYETREGFFLQSKAGDHNFLAANKDAWVGFNVSQIGYRAETNIREPRFFGTSVSANTGLYMEEKKEFNQDFGTTVFGATAGLSHKPFKRITAGLALRLENRDLFGDTALADEDPEVLRPRSLLALTPSLGFDTRDSFIYPKKGVLVYISTDISKGVAGSLDNFVKYLLDARAYISPAKRLTLAWAARIGHIAPYGASKDVADDQLFYLGGVSDVRGVDENMLYFDEEGNPIGGRTSVFGSMEARIDIGHNLDLPLFLDAGRLSQIVDNGIPGEFRYAVGTGLRYLTPIGPMGFLYGKNLNPKKGEPTGRLHFSIGYTF